MGRSANVCKLFWRILVFSNECAEKKSRPAENQHFLVVHRFCCFTMLSVFAQSLKGQKRNVFKVNVGTRVLTEPGTAAI